MTDNELKLCANHVRQGVIRGTHAAKSGHPGGSLSAADVLTYLYFEEMNVDPQDPQKPDRDRVVLSKGHAAPGLYAVLAEKGYFPKDELTTLRHIGSRLQGHPCRQETPGVDMSTGSLGQASRQRSAWHSPARSRMNGGAARRSSVTANSKKARSGKRRWSPATMRSTISP